MKKMTKLMAMIVALVVVLGTLPMASVFAATSLRTIDPCTEDAYSGTASWKVTANGGYGTQAELGVTRGETYSVELYVKPLTTGNAWFSLDGGTRAFIKYDGTNCWDTTSKLTAEATEKEGWWKLSATGLQAVSHATNTTWIPDAFTVESGFTGYIDGITITDEASGAVKKFDFEPLTIVNAKSSELYSTTSEGGIVAISGDKAYTGDSSMYVSAKAWIGKKADLGLAVGKESAIEFYIYPVAPIGSTGNTWVSPSGGSRGYLIYDGTTFKSTNSVLSVSATDKEGWWKVTYGGTPATETWDPNIFIVENGMSFYMDDLKVTDVAANTAKLFNFEFTYDKAKNLMATQAAGDKVSISWMNPSAPAPAEATLYDVSDGVNDILLTTVHPVAGEIVEYVQEGVAAGSTKVYRVDFSYANGKVFSQTVGCETVATMQAEYTTVGDWTLKNVYTPKSPAKMNLDDTVYKTAAPSLHIISNDTTYNTSNTYLQLKAPATVSAGSYRLSYYVKMNNAKYFWGYTFGTNSSDYRTYPTSSYGDDKINNVADWTLVTRDYTLSADAVDTNAIHFEIQGYAEDFWIDDVQLVALDGDGNPTGENLLGTNGDLSVAAAAPADLTDVMGDTVGLNEAAIISWTPTEDAEYVAIYDADNMDAPIVYIPDTVGYVDLKNLQGGKAYDLVVKTVNSEGRESAGTGLSVTPTVNPWSISAYSTEIVPDGTEVSVTIKNGSDAAKTTAQMFLAVYNSEGAMTSVVVGDLTDISVAAASNGVTLSETVLVPYGYTLKAFLWDSIGTMNILKAGEILE